MSTVPTNPFLTFRPQSFRDILGQRPVVDALSNQAMHQEEYLGQHLILAGPRSAGKMTIATLYAQAALCGAPEADGSPCQICNECRAVSRNESLSCIEIDALNLGDEKHIRLVLEVTHGLSAHGRRLFIVNNAEFLEASAADVMLKALEPDKRESRFTFIFVVNDISKFPFALRSRCQVLRVGPARSEELADHLAKMCEQASFRYERRALDVVVKTKHGVVGAAFNALAQASANGDLTLTATLQALKLDWGETVLRCWQALLEGRLNEAWSYFEAVASDEECRIRAMQSFLLSLHFRGFEDKRGTASLGPAFDSILDERWRPVLEAWRELARQRSITVDELARDLMTFWGGVRKASPSRSSFLKGYEVLAGARPALATLPE